MGEIRGYPWDKQVKVFFSWFYKWRSCEAEHSTQETWPPVELRTSVSVSTTQDYYNKRCLFEGPSNCMVPWFSELVTISDLEAKYILASSLGIFQRWESLWFIKHGLSTRPFIFIISQPLRQDSEKLGEFLGKWNRELRQTAEHNGRAIHSQI